MNDFYPEGLKTENKRSIITTAILAEAKVQQTVLEAPVIMCDASHNLIVNLGCMRGVIPRQEGAWVSTTAQQGILHLFPVLENR